MQRGRMKACRNNRLVHGEYGIQALEPVWLTSRQMKQFVERLHVIQNELENCGLKFSR
jgi:ribosomal protein L16/L10AE